MQDRAARRQDRRSGPFELDFISITHSIPEPNAVAIRTPLGTVVHTGDWKIDPDPMLGEATDDAALRRAGRGGRARLVCDSTNALVPGKSGSEADVRKTALHDLIGTLKGRVAVTAFASNVARLQYGCAARRARMAARSCWSAARCSNMVEAARETGYLKDFPPRAGRKTTSRDLPRTTACSISAPAARASRAPRWRASPPANIPTCRSAKATR